MPKITIDTDVYEYSYKGEALNLSLLTKKEKSHCLKAGDLIRTTGGEFFIMLQVSLGKLKVFSVNRDGQMSCNRYSDAEYVNECILNVNNGLFGLSPKPIKVCNIYEQHFGNILDTMKYLNNLNNKEN